MIYPHELCQANNLKSEPAKARLRYRVLYANENPFPEHGWLKGSVCDLADLVHLVDVPRSAFDKAAEDLRESIDSAVSVLENSAAIYLTDEIAALLGLTQRPPFLRARRRQQGARTQDPPNPAHGRRHYLESMVKTENFGFCIVDSRFALWGRGFIRNRPRRSAFFLCAGGGSDQTRGRSKTQFFEDQFGARC